MIREISEKKLYDRFLLFFFFDKYRFTLLWEIIVIGTKLRLYNNF